MLDPAPVGRFRIDSVAPPEHYEAAVLRAVERIRAGAFQKIVLAREVTVSAPTPHDAAWEEAAAEILSILDDVFTGYGITGADAVDAARFVRSVLHGFVSLELGGGFGLPQSADTSFRRLVHATNRALSRW